MAKYYNKSKCFICEKEFTYNKSSQSGKFCSNKWHSRYRYETEVVPKIMKGECSNRRTLRKYLLESKGDGCEICGQIGEWNGMPLTLQVDHIDGDSDNNILENLRLLCPNCHTQTKTWCSRNRKQTQRNKYLRKYKNETDA